MKKISISIFLKIWLAVSFLIIGYTVSMIGVHQAGNRIKDDLIRISNVFYPDSLNAYEALTAFKNQLAYYENAIEEGELPFIRKAADEFRKAEKALESIIRRGVPEQKRILPAKEILRELKIYYPEAQRIYSEMAVRESEFLPEKLVQSAKELALQKEMIFEQLSELHQNISDDLHSGIQARVDYLNFRQTAGLRIFIAVLLISLFSMWLVIRRTIALPVLNLLKHIRQIGEEGIGSLNFSPPDSRDEIGHLHHAFDEILSELGNSHQLMSHYSDQLEQDIEHRRFAQEKLEEAYAELRSAQIQLVQAAKLASIGELAAGVAHELNQPLMVIRATVQMIPRQIRRQSISDDELLEQLQTIERNTGRMMRIIRHLRIFSRESSQEFQPLNIHTVIEESFLMISEQLRIRNINVIKSYAPDLPACYGNANRLEQVFLNLISNARDAIGQKAAAFPGQVFSGKLEIISRVSQSHENCIEIEFRDNGEGIPPHLTDRIFDPFVTGKEVGKGTGLGLSISYGIIREHGGSIEIAETSSQGTTVIIRLPKDKKEAGING